EQASSKRPSSLSIIVRDAWAPPAVFFNPRSRDGIRTDSTSATVTHSQRYIVSQATCVEGWRLPQARTACQGDVAWGETIDAKALARKNKRANEQCPLTLMLV